jgi:hypothetical protein
MDANIEQIRAEIGAERLKGAAALVRGDHVGLRQALGRESDLLYQWLSLAAIAERKPKKKAKKQH